MATYKAWVAQYSNEEFDRVSQLASKLARARDPDGHGYSTEDLRQATEIVGKANRYSKDFVGDVTF